MRRCLRVTAAIRTLGLTLGLVLGLALGPAWPVVAGQAGDDAAPAFFACRTETDPDARLACYDAVSGAGGDVAQETLPAALQPIHTPLQQRWELDRDAAVQLFRPRLYAPNYVLPVHWTSRINPLQNSTVATRSGGVAGRIQRFEVKSQLSVKFKMAANVFGTGGNVWGAYTQQSYWQAWNGPLSRPFLATDYQPEFIWSQPLHFGVAGWTVQMLNLGVLHQSNGLSGTLSRSWNRVYAELGVDRANWTVLLRPWVRIQDSRATDDNPGIEQYIGRGQVLVNWRHGRQSLSLTVRDSLDGAGRGSAQVDYAVPIGARIKGYLQVFSGNGESIIDYNHRQTTVAVGFLITDWL